MTQFPKLTVESGIQAGLSATLTESRNVVGSGFDCCLVIADQQLKAIHFEIDVGDYGCVIRAIAGDVLLANGRRLIPGESVPVEDDVCFTAGNSSFALCIPTQPAALVDDDVQDVMGLVAAASQTRIVSILSGMVGLVACAMLVFTVAGLRAGRATPVVALHPATQVSVGAQESMAPAAEIVGALHTRLREAGLDMVELESAIDGSVLAHGMLYPKQMTAWAAIREWYDVKYGGNRVLVDQVAQAGTGPALTIAAVWSGSSPYVINDRGDKLFQGAVIDGSWTIDAIQPGQVVVENGKQKVSIRY